MYTCFAKPSSFDCVVFALLPPTILDHELFTYSLYLSQLPGKAPSNYLIPPSNLREVLHGKLLTTHMEEARKKEHLKEVMQRQELAEQQISKLEAELAEEQKKKEELVGGLEWGMRE